MSSAPSNYCKAQLVKDLKCFAPLERAVRNLQTPFDEDTVLYIHDNYIVRNGILVEDLVIFDDISEEWKSFCHERLGFAIPDFQQQILTARQDQ